MSVSVSSSSFVHGLTLLLEWHAGADVKAANKHNQETVYRVLVTNPSDVERERGRIFKTQEERQKKKKTHNSIPKSVRSSLLFVTKTL